MTYHIDAETIQLADLRQRIERTDLIPSRAPLLEGIEEKFTELKKQGITTLSTLRGELKNNSRLENLSFRTGIDAGYLILLRREIESFFPKPFALKGFHWLPEDELSKLVDAGIQTTASLYQAACSSRKRHALAASTGVDEATLEELFCLADLTRVQWVSPNAARMLMDAGITSVICLSSADANQLHAALERVNHGGKYFKGNIGLRDIRRLIHSAAYLSD